jgi:cation/acetate symporter
MVVNFVVAYAVSKFTKEVPQDVQDIVEQIRYPKGAGEAKAH